MLLEALSLEKHGTVVRNMRQLSNDLVCVKCYFCGNVFDQKWSNYRQTKGGVSACKACREIKRKWLYQQKHGVDNPMQLDVHKEKFKKSCKAAHGVEFPLQSQTIRDKVKETWQDRAGVASAFHCLDIQKKAKKTINEKYGAAPVSDAKVKSKMIATNLLRYGAECCLANKDVKAKATKTLQERYGTSSFLATDGFHVKYPAIDNTAYGKTQKEILSFLKEASGLEWKPNRTILDGKEIDLYCDELKIGVEYCGLYWHTEDSPSPRKRTYHYDKWKKCADKGIRLITIFEDEWVTRNTQVKGFLSALLKKKSRNIFARKCKCEEISLHEANAFLDENHIQGKANNYIVIAGLRYNGELVGVLTLSRHHRVKGETVLSRLCFKNGTYVSGGSEKLLKFALSKTCANRIVSWSDNRWSTGNVYTRLGFIKEGDLPPDYSYVRHGEVKRYSKQSQKKKAVKCPNTHTEKQWANERGFHRIWDCGKIKWVLTQTGGKHD